ncbi:HAD family hydrolase [Companilactobacillus sp. HBUAS56257]|uniref:HAD family hydrolase n=1 Tax=Companilactobacillus sp. HBUAS56257 TaxID=3109360 RepID=UPI002FF22B51
MAVKLILSDIDGTILDDQNRIDSNLKDCIKQLNKKGIPFILASARSPQGMLALAKELQVLDNPIACYNGALVVKDLQENDYTTILSHELDRTEVENIYELLKQRFPQISVNLYSGATWYVEKIDKWVKIEADITKLVPIEADLKNIIVNSEIPIHKLLLIGDTDQITSVLKFFQARFSESAFYLSKDNYMEITNKQVSKEMALRELANFYNLTLSETMTLGDNFNDVPMLDLAGLGVAMENAPAGVKKFAQVVTNSNNQNGVSYAIKKYALKEE